MLEGKVEGSSSIAGPVPNPRQQDPKSQEWVTVVLACLRRETYRRSKGSLLQVNTSRKQFKGKMILDEVTELRSLHNRLFWTVNGLIKVIEAFN